VTQQTPPGWYPDGQGNTRYWDGAGWSAAPPQPKVDGGGYPGPHATSPLPPINPATHGPKAWYQRKGFLIPAGVVGALIVIGGIASAVSPKKNVSSNGAPTLSSAASSPSSASAAPSTTAETTRQTKVAPVPPKTTSIPDGSFTMPNEVGRVLQTAQDDIQRVSNDPIFISHSHDLLGTRFQILDRDWKVCDQNIPPGHKVSAVGHVDFGVVKLDESCP
jgi:uncharacterized protein DUF2510